MTDVPKHCKRCQHDHATGILKYDNQNVPLYGARTCVHRVTFLDKRKRKHWRKCGCKKFKEDIGRFELEQEARRNASLPVVKNMDQAEVAKMYADTGYLSPQTPLESRVALYKLNQLPNKVEREREFQRLIAMVTMDTRAAFLRTDNKFANFVAQMDHILLAMQNVEQLNQRLASMENRISHILDVLEVNKEDAFYSESVPLKDEPIAVEPTSEHVASGEAGNAFYEDLVADMKERGYDLNKLRSMARDKQDER